MESNNKLEHGFWKNLRYDFPAGVVVFLVAIPLCLGIALASGTPLLSGLLAGMIGGLVIPFISRSELSVSGPAAGLIAIVISAIEDLGSFETFLLATFIAGLIQLALGLLKAGRIAYLFPTAVIRGMLAAIGIILILKQIPHALGWDKDAEGEMSFFQPDGENTFTEIILAIQNPSLGAIIIAVICLGILITWEKVDFLKKLTWLPGPLVVVLLGIGINLLLGITGSGLQMEGIDHMVAVPVFDSAGEVLSSLTFPNFGEILNYDIWIIAITIALVASLETLLSVEAVDKLDPFRRESPLSRELVAQGVGNSIAGLIGALPITAVIVRSSANVNSGGRTRASSVIHGSLLLISVLFLGPFLNLIPLSALAAILLMIGFKLAQPALFKSMYKNGMDQFLPFVITIVAVLLTDLLIGILVGIAVGIFFVIRTNYHSAISVTTGDNGFEITFHKDVSFLNKAKLVKTIQEIPEDSKVVIRGEDAEFMDNDILDTLVDFKQGAPSKNIAVQYTGFNQAFCERLGLEGDEEGCEDVEEDGSRNGEKEISKEKV